MAPLRIASLSAAVLALRLRGAEARLGGPGPVAEPRRPAPPALCDEALVLETCALLGSDGTSAAPHVVGELLAATPEAIAELWAAAALPAGEAVPCDALCHGTTALLEKLGRRVPPASDTGCYDNGVEVVCDLDLSPTAITRIASSSSGDFAVTDEGLAAMGHAHLADEGNATIAAQEEAAPEPTAFAYGAGDLAARVAQLFRIYPALTEGVSMGEAPMAKGAAGISPALLERRLGESTAYLNLAIRTFPANGTRPEVTQYFGTAATTDKAARRKILSVLNSIGNVLAHAHFVHHGEMCSPYNFGYVVPLKNDPLERDASGRFMIYLCGMFWATPEEQICTLVHEASHHAPARTKDIIYGAEQCKDLAAKNSPYTLENADNYGYYIREVAQSRGAL